MFADVPKELNRGQYAFRVFALQSELLIRARADCNQYGVILFPQFLNGNVLTDFQSMFYFHPGF